MARKFNGIYGEDVPLSRFWEYSKQVIENAIHVEVWITFESRPENLEDDEEDTFGNFDVEFEVVKYEDGKVYGYADGTYCYFDQDCLFHNADTDKVIGYAEPIEIAEV